MTAAPWAYFDTSALVKRDVRENGSARVRALARRHRLLSSAVAAVEAAPALSRRLTAGDLSRRDFAAITARIREDRACRQLVEVSPLVLGRAEERVRDSPLRTLDAIHVASALVFRAASGSYRPFVTGDSQQREAAGTLGLDVVWVE